MKTGRRPLTALSLAAATVLLASGCAIQTAESPESGGNNLVIAELNALLPEKVRDSGVLTVATDPQYPPCDFVNEDGEIDGFNHDILMGMAPYLGVEIEQEAISFDGLLPGVQSGRFDAAMECITDNLERQQVVQFVDYAYATKSIITTAENPNEIAENPLSVCGLHAGVQTGTEFVEDAERFSENCEQEGLAPVSITNFPSAGDQNTALQSGRIDFAFTNTATGVWQNKESGNAFAVVPSPLLSRTYVGIVVDLNADDLADALLGALEASIADGVYGKIMAEWGLEDIVLEEPGINLASVRPLELPELCGACGF